MNTQFIRERQAEMRRRFNEAHGEQANTSKKQPTRPTAIKLNFNETTQAFELVLLRHGQRVGNQIIVSTPMKALYQGRKWEDRYDISFPYDYTHLRLLSEGRCKPFSWAKAN